MDVVKKVGFICWFALLVGVILAIHFQDSLRLDQNDKIARIDSKSGDMMYREEGLVRWRDAVDSQEFADGDWVATGPESTATLAFRSGQVLKLGPDTQVQMRSIVHGDNDYSYLVTLSRGAVIAEVKKNRSGIIKKHVGSYLLGLLQSKTPLEEKEKFGMIPSGGMVVRSGNHSFAVDSGSKVGLFKDIKRQETKSISEIVSFQSPSERVTLSKLGGDLKPSFLPPIAKAFPENKPAIVVAKDAALALSVPTIQDIRPASEPVQKGRTVKAMGTEKAEASFDFRISPADLAALSVNALASRSMSSEGAQMAVIHSDGHRHSNGQLTQNVPSLRQTEKINRPDWGRMGHERHNNRDVDKLDSRRATKVLSFNKADPHIVVPKKRASYSQVGPVPLPEVSAKGYEYFLNIPDRFLYVDVYRPVSSVRRDKVKVNLIPPTKVPSGGDIRPVVELVGKNGSKIPRIEGHSSGDLDLIIPLDVVITYGREKSVGAFREFEVSARAGSIVTLNDVRSESFERTFSVIKVRAYGDGVSQGITIGLDQVEPVRNPNAMGKKKEDISPLNAQVRISLQSERDLASIMSFIQAANKVGMVKGGPSDELGYFIVRRRSVVAQVGGRGLSKKILQLVTSSLQGDFVFKGYRRSLHDSGDKSQRDLALWIDSLLDQGKVLYVMKRDKLYPVSREFVKTNAEVARFIDSQAKALFVDKVDVISFR